MKPLKIGIIGAGLGGLSAAALLSARGHTVELFEQNDMVGGKMQQVSAEGFRFDTGPSLLTMPFVVDRIFHLCGKKSSDYLQWESLDPLCRYFFPDGTVFTNYQDKLKNRSEILRIAPEDLEAWDKFLDYSAELYRRTSETFLFNPLVRPGDLDLKHIPDLFRIDAFSTVSRRVDEYFSSPRLRQLFKRFTTYNGSSPYLAPATLNVIPYVELRLGGFHIRGGMYRLAESLMELAEECGAVIHTGIPVDLIVPDPARRKRVSGLMVHGSLREYDVVVANSDATPTYLNLLPAHALSGFRRQKISRVEPSCSGFVILLGINHIYPQLQHHNIFFSEDYEKEFRSIFQEREPPVEPTIYVSNTSRGDPKDAPAGCSNLFILVNAPYTSGSDTWHEWKETYADHILQALENRGLEDLRSFTVFQKIFTPEDYERKFCSNRGSIYGTSSNYRNAAFIRPRNRSPWFRNLYLCGGSTHPGGGIPLVLQSAINVRDILSSRSR